MRNEHIWTLFWSWAFGTRHSRRYQHCNRPQRMTKRKQQTALAKALSSETERAGPTKDRSVTKRGNQETKRSKRQRLSEEGAAEDHSPLPSTAAEGSIDDIFRQARAKQRTTINSSQKAKPALKAPQVVGSKDDIFNMGQLKQRRYDAEGLPVYTTDELNVGAGGDTDQCPFECKCCF